MNLFFQIQSLQLLIFCMHNQEFAANLDYLLLCFLKKITKVNHFLCCFIIFLLLVSSLPVTRSLIVTYVYISIESIDCILLLSFELKAVLLISSVNTLCLLLLNLCCIFNIDFSFYKFFIILFNTIHANFFLVNLFYYKVELLINSFYNFQF